MAGIGFRLQRILKSESYRGLIQAYLYSAIVSTGPWMLSIISLMIIGLISSSLATGTETIRLFRAVIVYTFAGTLVLTAPIQMGTTRYVADRLYVNDERSLAPCYHWTSVWMIAIGTVIASVFHAFAGLPLAAQIAGIVLFQAISLIWVGMIFLSAAKDYMAIVRAFIIGYGLSIACCAVAALWKWHNNIAWLLWGFTIGQVVLAALLGIRIRVEFPTDHSNDTTVREHWSQKPYLAMTGLFFSIGIWVDKVVFWIGKGEAIGNTWFRASELYDPAIFLGYLSIVPAMALFLIRIETAFYKHYAAFYTTITRGGDMAKIRYDKDGLVNALRLSAMRLLKFQGMFTIAALVLATYIADWLGFPKTLVPTLRICLLAAFSQVMLLILMIFLLYFDWEKQSALLMGLFMVLNFGLSAASIGFHPQFYGFGYLLACVITLVAGLMVFERRMEQLEFETFAKQPMRA